MSSTLQPEVRRAQPSLDACMFCSFAGSRAGHATIYEDPQVYVFLDDYPLATGHTLVVLKNHVRDVTELSGVDAAELGRTVAHIARALKDALGATSIYVASVGEQVQHVYT